VHEGDVVLCEELRRYEPAALFPEDVHSVLLQHEASHPLTVLLVHCEPLTAAGAHCAVHRAKSEVRNKGRKQGVIRGAYDHHCGASDSDSEGDSNGQDEGSCLSDEKGEKD
jgi:hypothetical protein